MEPPFAAYTGSDPYVFVCYAHDDSDVVFPEIAWLEEQGVNVWYDEGISGGTNWRGAIGDSLLGASHVLFYISRRSLASAHCNREIGLALDEGKNIIPVYLEDAELTSDLKVGLNRVQALYRNRTVDHQQRLLRSLGQVLNAESERRLQTPVRRRDPRRLLVAAIMLVGLAGGAWWFWSVTDGSGTLTTETKSKLPSIAVLPFVNMSPDPDQEFFSDGVSEEILNLLAKNPAIRVISRSSAFSFKNTNNELSFVAEKLGVDHVLEGSVRRSGDTVRVSVQLIDATKERFLWSDTYDRKLNDILAVQSEIARHVARELNVALGELPATQVVNAEAYLLHSQARHLLGLGLPAESSRARELLLQAVKLDPGFVRAWTELARAHGQHRGREADAGAKSEAATGQALILNPDDPVANAWRGWDLIMHEYEFETGVQYYNKAMSLDPTNIDVLRGLENVLTLVDRPQEALKVAIYVVDRDPLCVICINNLARSYRALGQLDESSRMYQRSLTLRPDDRNAIANLAINELLQRDADSARVWIEQLPEDWPPRSTLLVIALHLSGQFDERDSAFTAMRARWTENHGIAMVHAFMGSADRAFAELEPIVSRRARGLPDPRNPLWGNLHSDPRWEKLLEESGLAPERLAKLEIRLALPG